MAKGAYIAPKALTPYELLRAQRIAANEQHMASLGIQACVQDFVATCKASSGKKTRTARAVRREPIATTGPARRSTRLQGVTQTRYTEPVALDESEGSKRKRIRSETPNSGPTVEEYTEEDEKLLGSYSEPWTLFVDGCNSDGKRIYDSVVGKTCHQCRQKTLGHRTSCSHCKLIQGQFCGDCLFMRYGENVLEANTVPGWKCPPCRGICNCSICRIRKGWSPTGALWQKVAQLGFKSVAHYLISTRRKAKLEPKQANSTAEEAKEGGGARRSKVKAGHALDKSSSEEGSSGVTGDTSHLTHGPQPSSRARAMVNSRMTSGAPTEAVEQHGRWSTLSVAERVRARQRKQIPPVPETIASKASGKSEIGSGNSRKRSRKSCQLAPEGNGTTAHVEARATSVDKGMEEELNQVPARRSGRKSTAKRIDWSEALKGRSNGHKTGTEDAGMQHKSNKGKRVRKTSGKSNGNKEGGYEDRLYVIEKVIKWRGPAGRREALIKWEGFGDDNNSWEPEANITT